MKGNELFWSRLRPQQVIDRSLLPVLANTESAKRLAAIINLVPKEVGRKRLQHQ